MANGLQWTTVEVCDTRKMNLASLLASGVTYSIPEGSHLDKLLMKDEVLHVRYFGNATDKGGSLSGKTTHYLRVEVAKGWGSLSANAGFTLKVKVLNSKNRLKRVRLHFHFDSVTVADRESLPRGLRPYAEARV